MFKITCLNELDLPDAEARAMLGGFYSRSTKPIEERLTEIRNSQFQDIGSIKQSLKKYALGYGHRSLLDMADTPMIFIENASILAVKAIENTPLGNFQETSTRYIDFSNQPVFNPLPSMVLASYVLKQWIEKYTLVQPLIEKNLRNQFPIKEGQTEHLYSKAIKAKTFDICRSLLPTASTTNVALKMTLSSFKDHIVLLFQHPLPEVKKVAEEIYTQISTTYPFSFPSIETLELNTNPEIVQREFNFYDMDTEFDFLTENTITISCEEVLSRMDSLPSSEYDLLTQPRSGHTPLPSFFGKLGSIKIQYFLDYGSFRDLQRHRNTLFNKCSLLSGPALKFAWENYFNSIENDSSLISFLDNFIFKQFNNIEFIKNNSDISPFELQYFYPLGTFVKGEMVCSLPELVYIMELRSGETVHYSLRKLINSIYTNLPVELQHLINIKSQENEFSYKRGLQDILMQ